MIVGPSAAQTDHSGYGGAKKRHTPGVPSSAIPDFKAFSQAWGELFAWDASTPLASLFNAYASLCSSQVPDSKSASVGTVSTTGISKSNSTGCCASQQVSIEDLSDLWAAAKRTNREWEAVCMVRNVRSSLYVDGTLLQSELMLTMLCWAAVARQREERFFDGCADQVRQLVRCVAQRCTAISGAGDLPSLYEEVALCVALVLFGWHSGIWNCFAMVLTKAVPLRTENDVLRLTRRMARALSQATRLRCHVYADSSLGMKHGLSTADLPHRHSPLSAACAERGEALMKTVQEGEVRATSSRRRFCKRGNSSVSETQAGSHSPTFGSYNGAGSARLERTGGPATRLSRRDTRSASPSFTRTLSARAILKSTSSLPCRMATPSCSPLSSSSARLRPTNIPAPACHDCRTAGVKSSLVTTTPSKATYADANASAASLETRKDSIRISKRSLSPGKVHMKMCKDE